MSKRAYRPDFDPITKVPIIPVHKDMEGRDAPDQHPIEAITGLQDALDAKVGAEVGKGLSAEDFTSEEKAKLSLIGENAEANTIVTIKVNGSAVQPDEERAVDLDIPQNGEYADAILYNQSTGEIRLMSASGAELSKIQTPLRSIITSAEWDEANTRLILTKADGTRFLVPMQITLVPVIGDGVDTQTSATDAGVVVSLTQATKDKMDNTVNLTGSQEIRGSKTFKANVHIEKTDGPWLYLTSLGDDTTVSHSVAGISFDGTPEWAENYYLWAQTDLYTTPSSVRLRNRVWDYHRQNHVASSLIIPDAGASGVAHLTAPVAIQTSGGAVLPTESSTVVTGGMLAVDPQVVHSFGTEEIAGTKTFTSNLRLTGSDPTLVLKSSKTLASTGQATVIRHNVDDGEGGSRNIAYDDTYLQSDRLFRRLHVVGRDDTDYSLSLYAYNDGHGFAYAPPYLPVDASGNRVPPSSGGTIVTESMLATDPQVVHTFGAEEIVGEKTFSESVNLSGVVASKSVVTSSGHDGANWYKVYTIQETEPVSNSIVLWVSPNSPVLASSQPMGILMAVIRGSGCLLKWIGSINTAQETDLQKVALVKTVSEQGYTYTWDLYIKASNVDGCFLHRLTEFKASGPSRGWRALSPTSEDAQADLPSGENITVYYSE